MENNKSSSFLYVTTSYLSKESAHGIQIYEMSKAFFHKLKNKFYLISFGSENFKINFPSKIYYMKLQKNIRTLYLAIIVILKFDNKSTHIYTRDIALSLLLLFAGFNVCYECHSLPSNLIAKFSYRLSINFKRFKSIYISTSLLKRITQSYSVSENNQKRMSVQHDGVNINDYIDLNLKKSAYRAKYRKKLNLDNQILLVHTGALYKGGSEVFKYIIHSVENIYLMHVGGSNNEVSQLSKELDGIKNNYKILPRVDRKVAREMQIAADLLIHINSKSNNIHWCTSPLKVFEYMTTQNPIIFAKSESVDEILNECNAYPFEMDSPSQCIQSIKKAINDLSKSNIKTELAFQEVSKNYTWSIRAEKILAFLQFNK